MINTHVNLSWLGQFFVAIAIVVLAAVLYQASRTYLPIASKFLDLKARQDCATSYRLDFADKTTNTSISRPIDDLYTKCLTAKGI